MKMIRTIRYSLCALCLLSVVSCQKVEVLKFDPDLRGLNIWVGTSSGAVYEETVYNYSYAYGEGSVTFYARVYGVPVDYDRTFTLEPFGDSIEHVLPTIRTEEYVMPAGAVSGEYKVYFDSHKLASESMFSESDGKVSFRMVPNDNFGQGAEDMQSFTVVLRNRIAKPDNWDSANYPFVPLSDYFGSYSRVKYQFMIEHIGLIDFIISYFASTAIDESTNTISPAYAVYLQQLMQERLAEYNATHDTPLTDENGDIVIF